MLSFVFGNATDRYGGEYDPFTMSWWYAKTPLGHDAIGIVWCLAFALSFGLAVYVFFLLHRAMMKDCAEDDATFYYFFSQEQFIVYHLSDGTREIVATYYQDHTGALAAHADHMNAWQKARMQKASSLQEDQFADRFL